MSRISLFSNTVRFENKLFGSALSAVLILCAGLLLFMCLAGGYVPKACECSYSVF